MRGETMKDKSKKSTYSTTFGVDPTISFPELVKYPTPVKLIFSVPLSSAVPICKVFPESTPQDSVTSLTPVIIPSKDSAQANREEINNKENADNFLIDKKLLLPTIIHRFCKISIIFCIKRR